MKLNRRGILTAAVVSLLLAALFWGGFFRIWQDKLVDLLFIRQTPSKDIVIVAVDETSINSIGQWPWPRQVFAQLFSKTNGAKVIGIDVNFKEASSRGSADDDILSEAINKSAGAIVLSAELKPDGGIILPLEKFRQKSLQGFTNLNVSLDGIARRIQAQTERFKSFGFQIAGLFKKDINSEIGKYGVKLFRINYHGGENTYPVFSLNDVLDDRVPAGFFKDKIVLIGATAPDLHDFHSTPFGMLSGVEVQANIIQTFLNREIFTSNKAANLIAIVLLSFLAVIISFKVGRFILLTLYIILLLLAYNLLVFISFDNFFILDVFYPNLAAILSSALSVSWQYIITRKEKKFIQDSFSRYLAPEVVNELIKNPGQLKLGGIRKNITILFSDIRGFTALSEKMPPEQLTHFLNRYLSAMTGVIMANGGLVDKYIGDAIMAFWGAPLDEPDHALKAVLAALKMVEELAEFNQKRSKDDPAIETGIGLNSGEVTVGNMGSEKRFDYTVIGDNVNLASRLEGLNKYYRTKIIASHSTVETIGQEKLNQNQVVFREIDTVKVKGKKESVKIFELFEKSRREFERRTKNDFSRGLDSYYRGNFKEAIAGFDKILDMEPENGPASILKKRCQTFVENPPADWQGIYELLEK